MALGKVMLAVAFAAALHPAALLAGEDAPPSARAAPSSAPSSAPGASAPLSIRRNATVAVGGEIRMDYAFRTNRDSATALSRGRDARTADLALRGTNLRIRADVHPNVRALLKIDLSASKDLHKDEEDIVEEAMLVMSAVGGTGFGFFAGKGRAPYGQDVTLGMLQSYHHAADQADSSEGRISLVDPPDGDALPPMRPGQVDRVFAAGATYAWDERWKVEAAVFQPNRFRYEARLHDWGARENPAGLGAAARVWWQPFEELVVQASAIVVRSGRMAETHLRKDILPGTRARGSEEAVAVSAGFDYRRGEWRVFGEYQHGWDWNFTEGYATDAWQAGAAYDLAPDWRIGAMLEGLHIGDAARGMRTAQYKAALNLRHTFANGLFILAEYGHERRRRRGALVEEAFGHFVGMRLGFTF